MSKKLVAAADLHLDSMMVGRWDSEAGMHSNWIESYARLDDIIDICNHEKADLLVIAGDLFHTGRPSAEAVAMAIDRFNRLETAELVITNGNHDQTSVISRHRTPIDAYIASQPFCFHAADDTGFVEHDGLILGLVPWYRVAGSNSMNETSDVLRNDVARLADQVADTDKPSMLFGHFTLDDFTFSSGKRSTELMMSTSVLEATLSEDELLEGPWSMVRAGHIHRRQGMYIGSTYKVSFGEADEEKGVDVITIEDDGTISDHRFEQFDTRELVLVNIAENGVRALNREADALKHRDILRLLLAPDKGLTPKASATVDDLRGRGVEVEIRHLPRERKIVTDKKVSIDIDPRNAMELYAKHHVADSKERKKILDAFADVTAQVEG